MSKKNGSNNELSLIFKYYYRKRILKAFLKHKEIH